MEFLSRALQEMARRVLPAGRPQHPLETTRVDAYVNAVYKVLVWDDPKLSFLALGALHVLLWLIVQLKLRFYGAIFMVIIVMLLCDLFFERRNLKAERSTSATDAMQQVESLLTGVILYLRSLRKDNPSAFCFAMCGVFLCIMIVARSLSGFALTYLIMIAIFTGPLIISKIPPEYLLNFKLAVETIGRNEGILAESELLPFIANKEFNEQDADLDSLLTDKTADSITNSLISGITCMPSHLDAEGGSLDGLEEEDLEFAIRSTQAVGVSFTPGECSSDSDSEHKSMNFEASHFNGDSSSEDENCYAKGLQFSEVGKDVADIPQQEGSTSAIDAGILTNLTTLSSSLIASVLKGAITNTNSRRKDSDSDFEIIDSDEVDTVAPN